eukprot:gene5839-6124_t
MYSVVSGAVKGIVGDENDPHLQNLVKMTADELVEMHAAKIIGEEISTSRANFNAAYGLVGTEYGSKLLDPAAGLIAADIEAMVEVVTEMQDELAEELKREAEAGEKKISRHTIPSGPTIVTCEAWDSFSGCDLDCRAESGQSEYKIPTSHKRSMVLDLDCRAESGQSEYQMLDFPQKVHGAVSVKDCLVTLLVISKQAYSKAMHMQMDLLVQTNVDHCCRLPFLRHTPLRELFRLSCYLQVGASEPIQVKGATLSPTLVHHARRVWTVDTMEAPLLAPHSPSRALPLVALLAAERKAVHCPLASCPLPPRLPGLLASFPLAPFPLGLLSTCLLVSWTPGLLPTYPLAPWPLVHWPLAHLAPFPLGLLSTGLLASWTPDLLPTCPLAPCRPGFLAPWPLVHWPPGLLNPWPLAHLSTGPLASCPLAPYPPGLLPTTPMASWPPGLLAPWPLAHCPPGLLSTDPWSKRKAVHWPGYI